MRTSHGNVVGLTPHKIPEDVTVQPLQVRLFLHLMKQSSRYATPISFLSDETQRIKMGILVNNETEQL